MKPAALTCGDPGGIGPEVAVKAALAAPVLPRLVGPRSVWEQGCEIAGVRGKARTRLLAAVAATPERRVKIGAPSKAGGQVAMDAIDWAIRAALAREVSAVITAPVCKTSLRRAGYDYPGQTEYFAEKCGGVKVAMMLAGPSLRVVLCSTHVSLRDAVAGLSAQRVFCTARIAHASLCRLLGQPPRLGLCALNPHAGEGGLFGDEESRFLVPAVRRARRAGISLSGPFPADTLFVQAVRGAYDAVIVLFHDQGLIPLKLLHFDTGVNLTLGLPIIRASPDHGTAFDIAGSGCANPASTLAALRLASQFDKQSR